MARLRRTTISRRTVEALRAERDTVFWDSELLGFGVRVYPTGRKVYVVQTRAGGRNGKRVTVGRHGVISAEEARRRAALIVARIKAGEAPVPEPLAVTEAKGPTVADLAQVYLKEVVAVRLKESSAASYRYAIDRHILPRLGGRPALSLDHAAVSAFHHSLARTPTAANRAVEMLSRIYRAAEERELVPEGSNPCRQIAMNRQRRHERFLTDAEFRRLGRALDDAEAGGGAVMYAALAIRLLLLTRLPQERNPHPALGAGRPGGAGDAPSGHEDGSPDGAAVAGRRRGAGAHPAGRRQPPCHPGSAERQPHDRPSAALGEDSRLRRTGDHAAARLPAQRSRRGRWRWARACR